MKQKFTSVLYFLSLLFITTSLISCKGDDDPTGPAGTDYNGRYGTVTGRFISPNGEGIAGVTVSVQSNYTNITTVRSDSLGNFVHNKVPAGNADLKGSKGKFTAILNAVVTEGSSTRVPPVTMQPANKMAVVLGYYDSIEEIIMDLGYPFDTLTVEDLADPARLNINKYSALFINGGAYSEDTVAANLLKFVRDGGLLYTSDWASDFVELILPGKISFIKNGQSQEINASVIDPVLKVNLSRENIRVIYDLGLCTEIETIDMTQFKEIVRGTYQSYDGLKTNQPLAVYRNEGLGVIVYTTFHNEANATTDMMEMLKEFIFF